MNSALLDRYDALCSATRAQLLVAAAVALLVAAGCSDDVEGEDVPGCDEVCGADVECMKVCRPAGRAEGFAMTADELKPGTPVQMQVGGREWTPAVVTDGEVRSCEGVRLWPVQSLDGLVRYRAADELRSARAQ
jgi:hypothetical protein